MLRWIAFPFWNAEERRLRALVRIGLGTWLVFFVAFSPFILLRLYRRIVPSPAPSWVGNVREIIDANYFHAREHNVEAAFTEASTAVLSTLLVLVASWLAARFLDRRSFDGLGFFVDRKFWLDLAFGFALGALLMLGIFGAERAFGWAQYRDAEEVGEVPRYAYAGVYLFSFLAIAIREEIVSRGYHLTNLAEGFRFGRVGPALATTIAIVLSSAVFGLGHAGNPSASLVSTGNIVIAGVWLALGYALTGKLAIPIGIHISWNYFQNLFGMPVSGSTDFFLGALVARDPTGPAWITGGAFGPEAGATGLIAMAIGTALTLAWVRVAYGKLRIDPRIAEYRRA